MVARLLLPPGRDGLLMALLASLFGWLLVYTVFHQLMSFDEVRAFKPKGLLPGTLGALLALVALGRLRAPREQRIFSR